MAWTVSFNLDDDKPDVGSVQAIWNAGQPDQFMFSGRVKMCKEDVLRVKKEAEARLAEVGQRAVASFEFASYVEDVLNSDKASADAIAAAVPEVRLG